jgi:hypothetical protein
MDINKFSFGQLTSNTNGKTSGTGTMGILICTVGAICFLLGCIDKMFISKGIDVITQSIIFVGIGASLMGYRKSQEKHLTKQDDVAPTTPEEPKQLNS